VTGQFTPDRTELFSSVLVGSGGVLSVA